MKFDIWTFLFQVLNFLVLLFILKRILYKPVREIIEQRRGSIQKSMEDAGKVRKEADELKEKNRKETESLQEARSEMLEKMRSETEAKRKEIVSRAQEEVKKIVEKEKSLFSEEQKKWQKKMKKEAAETASIFAASLMKDLSGEDLHRAAVRRFLSELPRVAAEIKTEADSNAVQICSAFPMSEEDLNTIRERFASNGLIPEIAVTVEEKLLAGIKLSVAGRIYDSSVLGQIESFSSDLREKG